MYLWYNSITIKSIAMEQHGHSVNLQAIYSSITVKVKIYQKEFPYSKFQTKMNNQ